MHVDARRLRRRHPQDRTSWARRRFPQARLVASDKRGAPFEWANRNKRSATLDLASDDGRTIAREVVNRADVVVENFSTGVMERLGLDYPTVSATNPGLIYCSISAASREGDLAKRAGFDPIAQAESGFMVANGRFDGVHTTRPATHSSTSTASCNPLPHPGSAEHLRPPRGVAHCATIPTAASPPGASTRTKSPNSETRRRRPRQLNRSQVVVRDGVIHVVVQRAGERLSLV